MTSMFGGAQPAILAVPVDKIIYLRESATNTYSLVPYMVSKVLVEIPYNFAFAILQLLIVYWAFKLDGSFILMAIWIFLGVEAGISTAYIVGSLASRPEQAIELAPLLLVPQFFFVRRAGRWSSPSRVATDAAATCRSASSSPCPRCRTGCSGRSVRRRGARSRSRSRAVD